VGKKNIDKTPRTKVTKTGGGKSIGTKRIDVLAKVREGKIRQYCSRKKKYGGEIAPRKEAAIRKGGGGTFKRVAKKGWGKKTK